MGLGDPEDVIPAIIVIITVLGLLGTITPLVPSLAKVPVLNVVTSTVGMGFDFLAKLLAPFININLMIITIALEVLVIILSIVIIVKFGY